MKTDLYLKVILVLIVISFFIPLLSKPPVTNKANAFVGNNFKHQIVYSGKPGWVWVLNAETGKVKVCFEILQVQSEWNEIFKKSPFCSKYSN